MRRITSRKLSQVIRVQHSLCIDATVSTIYGIYAIFPTFYRINLNVALSDHVVLDPKLSNLNLTRVDVELRFRCHETRQLPTYPTATIGYVVTPIAFRER